MRTVEEWKPDLSKAVWLYVSGDDVLTYGTNHDKLAVAFHSVDTEDDAQYILRLYCTEERGQYRFDLTCNRDPWSMRILVASMNRALAGRKR